MKLHAQFVVDASGARRSVLLPADEFDALMELLEDRLDEMDLDEAVEAEPDFEPYESVRERLRDDGHL